MFWIGFTIGLVLGSNISLFLYAIILSWKRKGGTLNDFSQFII